MTKPRVPRTDRVTTIWMCTAAVAAAVTIVARGRIPQNLWTMTPEAASRRTCGR